VLVLSVFFVEKNVFSRKMVENKRFFSTDAIKNAESFPTYRILAFEV